MSNEQSRRALTTVEFLALLLILGFLVCFLVIYIYRSREAAARAQCANNLKTIGEGFHHFRGGVPRDKLEGAPGVPLPAARIAPGYATWAVQIAPYLEPVGALKDWDMQKSYFDQPDEVRQAVSPLFLCPARERSEFLSVAGDIPPGGKENVAGAVGDYACASGDGDARFPYDGDKADGAIILGRALEKKGDLILRWQSRTDVASLVRGLSNTIVIGEKHVPLDHFGHVDVGDGSLYNGSNPPSFSRVGGPGFPLARSPTDPFNTNFGSYHPGVCQFLMADDSVRVLTNDVSPEILGRLIRRGE